MFRTPRLVVDAFGAAPGFLASQSRRRRRALKSPPWKRLLGSGLEQLEERTLLSVIPTLLGDQVAFQGDNTGNDLVLAVNAGTLEYSDDGGATFSADLNLNIPGVQSLTIDRSTMIDVNLGTGVNTLTIDASLQSALAALSGAALLDDPSGTSDTLLGPAATNQWTISGANSGVLDGAIYFQSVPNLTGVSGGTNNFTFQAGGTLSGTLTSEFESSSQVSLSGRIAATETFTETGPTSGQVTFDGQSIVSYSGVPSIVDKSEKAPGSTTRTLTINTPTASDHIHIEDQGLGLSVVKSDSSSTQFPSVAFENAGLTALDLNPGGGNSSSTSGDATLAIDPLESSFQAPVVVNAPDQITLLNIRSPAGLTVTAATSITAGPAIGDQQQVPISELSNWTPNRSYPLLDQASTTGSGTGMVVSVNVGPSGEPVATLVNFGSGYDPNDRVTFDPPNGRGAPITLEVNTTPVVQQVSQPSAFDLWTPNQSYTDLPQVSTTGSGTGMLADITIDQNGDPTVTVVNQGVGARIGDTVAFDPPDGVGTPVTAQVQPVFTNPTPSSSFQTWTPNLVWTTVPQSATSGIGTGMSAYITVDKNGDPTATVHDIGVTIPDPWTSSATFTNVAQASTTGAGTGMTANITVNAAGDPTATIDNPGSGYQIGDQVTFNPADTIGTPVMFQVQPVLSQNALSSSFAAWTPNQTYASVAAASTSGSGTGMNVSVTVNIAGDPTLTLLDAGSGYQAGDTVTFDAPDGVGDAVSVTITGTTVTAIPSSSPGYLVGDTVTFYPPDGVGDPITVTLSGTVGTQVLNDGWTPNMMYTAVAPSSTTGSGTGMTVNIVTDDLGDPTLTLDTSGTGYQVGDSVTFNEPNTGAAPISAVVASVGTVTQLPGAPWSPGQIYDNVSPNSTSGFGIGMVVNITVDAGGNPVATLVRAGTGYVSGDTVFFDPPDGVGDPLSVQVAGGQAPVISTREIAQGADPVSAFSTGNSGTLTLGAPRSRLDRARRCSPRRTRASRRATFCSRPTPR